MKGFSKSSCFSFIGFAKYPTSPLGTSAINEFSAYPAGYTYTQLRSIWLGKQFGTPSLIQVVSHILLPVMSFASSLSLLCKCYDFFSIASPLLSHKQYEPDLPLIFLGPHQAE